MISLRKSWVALLLLVAPILIGWPRLAHADEGRAVGYVLSFRMGVPDAESEALVDELAKATSKWLGQDARQGKPVAKNCASDGDCVRRAATKIGVTRLGIVAIVAAGGVVRLEVRLMDAKSGGEILRTHAEYEQAKDSNKAAQALYDLMPRLLPGEKVALEQAATRPEDQTPLVTVPGDDPLTVVPPVADIPKETEAPTLDLSVKASPKQSGARWWLWGGLGVATTAAVVTAILLTRESGNGGPVLDLPPAQ